MKKMVIAVVAALFAVGCASSVKEAAPTIFRGRIIGYSGQFTEFFLPNGAGEFREIPLNVAPDGTFCDTIDFGEPIYDAPIFVDRFMFRTFVEPGKTYDVEFNITREGDETNFHFIGEGEKENAFLAHLWRSFAYAEDVMQRFGACSSFNEYRDSLSSVAGMLRSELAESPNKKFSAYYNGKIAEKEAMFAAYYALLRLNASGVYRPEKEYLEFMSSHLLAEDALVNVADEIAYGFVGINLREGMRALADMCPKKLHQKAFEQLISSCVGAGNTAYLTDAIEYYKENVKQVDEQLLKNCEGALSIVAGVEAPDIECVDVDGGVHHLSDFAGKPLYIDLWASWCGPCCEEIPHLAKMVEALGSDPEIVCISISIDEEKSDWIAKLDEENPSWPQYLATEAGQTSISRTYNVSGIPRFLLVAADGTIASANAPRPSTPDVINALRALL